MDELLEFTRLFDLYKGLLTEHQQKVFRDYYFENLTIEEIALNSAVSKNAIAKTIRQVKQALKQYEEQMHFLKYIEKLKNEFKNEEDVLKRINKYDNIIL